VNKGSCGAIGGPWLNTCFLEEGRSLDCVSASLSPLAAQLKSDEGIATHERHSDHPTKTAMLRQILGWTSL
jgi:hypothetical protein